jgi:hypothetical protein
LDFLHFLQYPGAEDIQILYEDCSLERTRQTEMAKSILRLILYHRKEKKGLVNPSAESYWTIRNWLVCINRFADLRAEVGEPSLKV